MSYIDRTRRWVEDFVIARALCPFARTPYEAGLVRISEFDCKSTEEQLSAFWQEVELIERTGPAEISNTIIVIPALARSFEQYLDLFEMATDLLKLQGKADVFQLASFHPLYQFEGTDEGDPTNYTNRSPAPLIHIIRVDEVTLILRYPNPSAILLMFR